MNKFESNRIVQDASWTTANLARMLRQSGDIIPHSIAVLIQQEIDRQSMLIKWARSTLAAGKRK